MVNKQLSLGLLIIILLSPIFGDEKQITPQELAKLSEATAAEKSNDKASPELIINKVNEAVKLLKEEGLKAFPKFKGKDSPFLFSGTYIWIHDLKGIMRMHPIKYKMEGKRLIGLKDVKGKRFFTMMNKVAKEDGSGWVSYYWPKPGDKKPALKVSYVKLCTIRNGERLVVGCGTYDLSEEQVMKLTGEF